jgi:hypothetical protein
VPSPAVAGGLPLADEITQPGGHDGVLACLLATGSLAGAPVGARASLSFGQRRGPLRLLDRQRLRWARRRGARRIGHRRVPLLTRLAGLDTCHSRVWTLCHDHWKLARPVGQREQRRLCELFQARGRRLLGRWLAVPRTTPFRRVCQDCRKASRSALIVSACVVGMPCGNPVYVFSVPFCRSFADSGPAAT